MAEPPGRLPTDAFLFDCEDDCAHSSDGSVRVALPAAAGFPEHLWQPARPHRRQGASCSAHPTPDVPHQRRYIPGTMVLETTWHTPTGWLLVQDFMVVSGPVEDGCERRTSYRRAPGVAAATGTLLRMVTCIGGRVESIWANCIPELRVRDHDRSDWDYDGRATRR